MLSSDYMVYVNMAWEWAAWLPYLLITYVFLTLLPKSLVRMKHFANADYEANRNKFHRCYGPELCCHVLAQESSAAAKQVKQKTRKPVTRVYPKRHQQQPQSAVTHSKDELPPLPVPVKRSNVTKIARMFETGNTGSSGKPTTRVSPLTLPEIRMFGASEESNESTPCASRKSSIASHLRHIEQAMLQLEEELQHHHHQPQSQQHPVAESGKTSSSSIMATHSDWEPMAVPVLRHGSRRGTSATPSTASPLSSSSPEPPASPVMLRQPTDFCLDLSMENIFQAIARSAEESDSLSPVTCIDDILSERRFSRPLSAYSITDLLNEELASSSSSSTCHHLDDATYVNDAR